MLDCKTTSVVLPAHDGQRGILYNHMPMFCKLGLGLMKATCLVEDQVKPQSDVFLLIDGGFTLNSSNTLTIIAEDAVSLRDAGPEKIDHILEKAKKKLAAPVPSPQYREHEAQKFAFLTQLIQIHTTGPAKETQPSQE